MHYVKLLQDSHFITIGSHVPERLSRCFDSPQVSVLKREVGEPIVLVILGKALNECLIKTGSNMHKDAVAMLAASILQDFGDWRFDEILYVLCQGIKGRYAQSGKATIYGQLSFQLVYEWCNAHNMDRSHFFEHEHLDRKASAAGDAARSTQPTPFDGMIAGLNAIGMSLQEHKTSDEKYFLAQAEQALKAAQGEEQR